MLYFIVAQGYDVQKNIIYQDNKSSITLEQNGRASSSKRIKHIKVRYFFIKDVVEHGEASIEHCPTKQMWADVLTKLLQGQVFYGMRAKLMGCAVDLAAEESAKQASGGEGVEAKITGVLHGKNDGGVTRGVKKNSVLRDSTNSSVTREQATASLRGCE